MRFLDRQLNHPWRFNEVSKIRRKITTYGGQAMGFELLVVIR
jgi:hypothetical protein